MDKVPSWVPIPAKAGGKGMGQPELVSTGGEGFPWRLPWGSTIAGGAAGAYCERGQVTSRTVGNQRRTYRPPPSGGDLAQPESELAQIVHTLTADLDHFSSALQLRRRALEDRAERDADGSRETFPQEAEAIRIELAAMVVRIRRALDEMHRIRDESTEPGPRMARRSGLSRLARNRQTG